MAFAESAERMLARLVQLEKSVTCGQESRQNYLAMHGRRFADILSLCRREVPNASARVLDIGRCELTAYLSGFYRNIQTLGLDPLVDDGGHREVSAMGDVPHITFDFLDAPHVSRWPEGDRFDLIVFSEVLEHLHVAPEFVLTFLSSLLSERGILVCTTPNAAEIGKRIRMAMGRNPYERLRLYEMNPGHVREYTKRELGEIAKSVGLSCRDHSYFNWIEDKDGNPIKALLVRLIRAYPAFRPFQMCILERLASAGSGE
ncbi:class I SAM-dependent methyltransferase [Granulicella sp. dw_53]|uniref:class I SAM-dependent methyltransferase n=1 Tax=Granulicella sp. dw_53 TaxID=2719792 RepID=UPI001BD1CFEF|nr:class I SAM-dependent methyltransferase [Granulicella sp. dw_53]